MLSYIGTVGYLRTLVLGVHTTWHITGYYVVYMLQPCRTLYIPVWELFWDLSGRHSGPLPIHPFGGFWRVPEIPLDAGVYRNAHGIRGLCHFCRVPVSGT